jgi:hypothetical protein
MKITMIMFSFLAALLMSSITRAELVVVMRADAGIQQLSVSEINRIFLDKRMALPNGAHAVPVDQPKGNLRDQFYAKFLGKTRAMISAYWAQRMFTGGGRPPAQMESAEAVMDFLKKTPNAVAYMDDTGLTKELQVVARLP